MHATVDKSASYVEIGRIAKGGLGIVEMVLRREGEFERVYAMKRPHPHLVDEPHVRHMFFQEARLAGLLQHPNVVSVLDVGEDERGPYLLMDYVEGLSLQEVIRHALTAGDLVPLAIVVQIGLQAAKGLNAAHGLIAHDGTPTPLVHRDVSPQNLLVGFDGVVRIADFGIAKALGGDGAATTTHMLKGKTGYMSPEQLRFEGVDHRSDLFALGVVLFETAAGRRLYKGASLEQVAQKILHDPPPELASYRGDVDAELERVLMELLVKDRAARIQDAKTLTARLEQIRHRMFGTEEWVELAEYMNTELAQRRDELRSRRSAALESVQRRRTGAVRAAVAPAARMARWPWVAVLALVILGGVTWLATRDVSESGESESESEARADTEAESEADTDTDTEAEAEVDSESAAGSAESESAARSAAESAAEAASDDTTLVRETTMTEGSARRRKNRGMRTMSSEMMTSTITSMWWD